MTSTLKTIALGAIAAAAIAAQPALAATPRHPARHHVPAAAVTNANGVEYGQRVADPAVVTDGATYIGRDPDPQIRTEILKDDSMHNGNAY
jgi:hypothetical protein